MNELSYSLITYGIFAFIVIAAILLCMCLALPKSLRIRLSIAIPTCLALGYAVITIIASETIQQLNTSSSTRAIHDLAEHLRNGNTNIVVNTILTSDEVFSKSQFSGMSFEKIMWMSDTGDETDKSVTNNINSVLSTVVPVFSVSNMPPQDVISDLTEILLQMNPPKRLPVVFELTNERQKDLPLCTFSATILRVDEILKLLSEYALTKLVITPDSVVFKDYEEGGWWTFTQIIKGKALQELGLTSKSTVTDVQKSLQEFGINFASGCSMSLIPSLSDKSDSIELSITLEQQDARKLGGIIQLLNDGYTIKKPEPQQSDSEAPKRPASDDPFATSFQFESIVIPTLSYTNATVREALDEALQLSGLTNNQVVLFREEDISKRITADASGFKLGEALLYLCDRFDLTLIRQPSQKNIPPNDTIILRPTSVVADQTTEAFHYVPPHVYDDILKDHKTYGNFMVQLGFIERESDLIHEYQRDRGVLILHAPRESLRRFRQSISWFNYVPKN